MEADDSWGYFKVMLAYLEYLFLVLMVVWIILIPVSIYFYSSLKRYVFNNHLSVGRSIFPEKEIIDASIGKDNRLSEFIKNKEYYLYNDSELSRLFERFSLLRYIYKLVFFSMVACFLVISFL